MNNKFFNKKYRQMSALFKTKTTLRSKFSALGALLLVLNFGVAWGQTEIINMTQTSRTVDVDCGKTYTFELQANNATATRTYIFRPDANTSIKIDEFTFHAVRQTTSSFMGSGTTTYDFLEISYGSTTLTYGNENDNWGNDCHEINGTGFFSSTTTYYHKNVTIPEITDIPKGVEVKFTFYRNTNYSSGGSCTRANFSATITTSCCPECPTLSETLSSNSATLSWGEVSSTATYSVAVTKDGQPYGSGTYNAGTNESLSLNDLTDGTYTWTLTFIEGGCTVTCEPRTFTVCTSLSCVNPNTMTPRGGVEVTSRWLSWDPVPCATGYNLYYSTDRNTLISDANKKVIVGGDNTQYLIPIMPEGVVCYWTVIPTRDGMTSPTCTGPDYIKSFKVKYTTSDDKDLNVLPSTEGNEFYFSFMENGYYPFGNDIKYTAVIAPSNTGQVTFHFYSTGRDTVVNVTQGVPATITFKESDVYHSDVGDQYSNRTVKVTCNFNISLYIANEATNSFDASIVLPTSALGTEYMIQTYPNGDHSESSQNVTHAKPCFMVIGTADNTPVRISGPTAKINALLPDPTAAQPDPNRTGISYFDITIDDGESYFMRSNSNANNNNDLSGIEVKVNPQQNQDMCKTISVFNGNTLTRVPYLTSISSSNRDYNMDHLFEQAYPTSNWGTKFAITSSLGFEDPSSGTNPLDNLEYEYIRITALKDNTEIAISGGSVLKPSGNTMVNITDSDLTLNAGETGWYALHRDDGLSCYIETSQPVACYFYQRSGYNYSTFDGDPSMVWISPIELGIEELTFATFKATNIQDADHYINIVIPIEAINNGQAVTLTPAPYNSTNTDISSYFKNGNSYNYVNGSNNKYAYARVRINHGTYTLRSNGGGKMVIHAYGIGEVRGYAYNAGSAAVEYRSNFVVGGADGNTWLDVSSLKDDHHFCSGTTYRFRVNSNATNVERVEINYGDGSSATIIPSSGTNYAEHKYTDENEYEIEARVYSRVYDNELCQEDLVVDIIRDVVLAFASQERYIDTTICPNTEFKFQEKFYQYNSAGVLEKKDYRFPPEGTILMGNSTYTTDTIGYTKYGCKVKMHFSVKVYDNMNAGSIITTSEQCINNNSTIQLSVTKLLSAQNGAASGGDPTAHYQWQYSNLSYNDNTPPSADDASWTDINNQGETHTVTTTGWYRRAYISECGTLYSNAQYASVEGAFNPGVHADASIKVCSNVEVDTTIGTQPDGLNAAGTYVTINGTSYSINFQWQDSVRGGTWNNITNANAYQYNVHGTFEQTTFYRRLITGVGDCQLALDMGVFTVEVNPTFNFEYKVFSGCGDGTKAKIQFTITDGSGTYKVYYMNGTTEIEATNMGGGVYEFPITANTTNSSKYYNIKIEDQLHGCKKSANVEVKPVVPLSISNFGTDDGCRGAQVSIPYPTISGGTPPYTLELQASSLGINSNVTVPENTPYTISKIPETADPGPNTVLYKVTDASGCYVGPVGNGTVIVYANPDLKISKTNIDNCASPNGLIVVEVRNPSTSSNPYLSNPNYTFVKTSSNPAVGTTTATQGGTTISYGNLPQGSYVVDVTDGHGCKTKSESVIIEDYLNIEIGTSATVEGESIADVHGFYVTCPNSTVKLEITSLKDKTNSNSLSTSDYQYSFDGGEFGDNLYKEFTMPETCPEDVEVSIRAKNKVSQCIEEIIVTIEVRDNNVPVVTGSQTIEIPTYFCETFEMPNLADLISVTGGSCGIKKVDVTQTSSPAVDGEYNVAANQTDGITVTVKATNLCGKESTPAQIVVKPIPWPAFKINGTGTDNNCYCHGDNIVLTAVVDNGTQNGVAIDETTYPEATYQWYKGTTPITDGGRYSGATTKELKISSAISTEDATNGDDGEYRLVITDPEECTKEATIRICVHPNIKFNLE